MNTPAASTPASAPAPAPTAPASMADAIGAALAAPPALEPAAPEQAPADDADDLVDGGGDEAPPVDADGAPLRGPDGKFAKKGADAKPPLEPKKEPPKPDEAKPDDLTPPDGLSEKGQRRFQKLVNTNKELTGKLAEYEPKAQAFDEFQAVLREHGVEREQFDVALDFFGAFHRGDLRGALAILDEQRAAIAEMMGQEVPGVDLLQGFDDLQQQVTNMQMPRETAVELAARRRREAQQRAAWEQQQHQQQATQQMQQQREKALSDIDAFLLDMQRTDLDYAAKSSALEQTIVEACRELPPSQWAPTVKRMYALVGKVRPASSPSPAGDAPLRPNGNATGARPQPASMAEAIGAGLGF